MSRVQYAAGVNPPAVSEVLPDLFMGRRPETYAGYDLVVSCELHLARGPMEGYEGVVMHIALEDRDDFPIPDSVYLAVLLVLEALRQDAKVLVHCTGGLNRSGLVMALIVAMLEEISGEEAIELLRERHDPWVLCNPTFELYVRNVAGEEPA